MHRRKSFAIVGLVIAGLLIACSAGTNVGDFMPGAGSVVGTPKMDDSTILAELSPKLSAAERAIMYRELAMLPARYRHNVIYVKLDGTVYATDPTLLRGVRVYSAVPGRPGWFVDRNGRTQLFPDNRSASAASSAVQPAPTPTTNICDNKGFCNRLYSDYSFNFIQAEAKFSASSVNLWSSGNSYDAGYAYLGEDDAKVSGSNPLSVDAGIQVLPTKSFPYCPLSVQAYLHVAGGKVVTYSPSGRHYSCEPFDGELTYFPVASSFNPQQVAVVVDGTDAGDGKSPLEVTAMGDVPTGTAVWFGSSCNGVCRVKRLTTVTTQNVGPGNQDGTFFGVNNPGGSQTPAMQWINAQKAQVQSNGSVTKATYQFEGANPGDVYGFPPVGTCQVPNTSPTGFASVTVGINWTKNAQNTGPVCPTP